MYKPMTRPMSRARLVAIIAASLHGVCPLAQAATDPGLSVAILTTDGTCAGTEFLLDYSWTSEVAEWNDYDLVGVVGYDYADTPVLSGWNGFYPPQPYTATLYFGGSSGMNPIAHRPIRIELWDITTKPPVTDANTQSNFDNILAQSATVPLLAAIDFDPATLVPDCANLPVVAPPTEIGIDNGFVKLGLSPGGPPPSLLCVRPDHYGRMQWNPDSEVLYICGPSGWNQK